MKLVQDLVTNQPVAGIGPSETVFEATRSMVEQNVGSLLVLDGEGNLLGIFTERDVMVRIVAAGKDPATTTVGEVMTHDLYTTTVDRTVVEVRREMRERHIRHVPVMDGDRALAVLGMRDLMRAALEEKREEVSDMAAYIRGEGSGPQ